MPEQLNDIRAELSDRPRRTDTPRKKTRTAARKTPAPVAKVWSSEVAQRWMDLALENGFEPPYNVNYAANEIEKRTLRDEKIMARKIPTDQARWVMKMVELFWKTDWEDGFTYVRAGDSSAKILDLFLTECWADVRGVAFDSLRASYLKEFGRGKKAPEYGPHTETEMHAALEQAKLTAFHERERIARGETKELHRLDDETRDRLRSAVENRRNS